MRQEYISQKESPADSNKKIRPYNGRRSTPPITEDQWRENVDKNITFNCWIMQARNDTEDYKKDITTEPKLSSFVLQWIAI